MLFASICLWFVIVYSVRVAVCGNPAFVHVVRADSLLLARAEALAAGESVEAGEAEIIFLRRFFMFSLLELVMFLLEVVVLAILWWKDVWPILTFSLLVKDCATVALSLIATWFSLRGGVFEAVLSLPRSIVLAERASAGISAVGSIFLFVFINRGVFSF